MLIWGKKEFKATTIKSDSEEHGGWGIIQQEDMTIVKVYVLDVMKSIYFKQMLVILNVDICSNMIILGTL